MPPLPLPRAMPSTFECVEIYVPKKLENVSELYTYLRKKLTERKAGHPQEIPIDGFSLYEVDGAFYGARIYEERTIIIRIMFSRQKSDTDESIQTKIHALGREIAESVTLTEEEFWICHYPQGVVIFRPAEMTS